MRIAVIADVHANLPALEVVLDTVAREKVDATVCLGDLVGYNASPVECVDRVRDACTYVVAGNHDRDCLHVAQPGTRKQARIALDWTRDQLDEPRRAYLRQLAPLHLGDGFVAAHGSYLSTIYVSGYVTSTMLEENLVAIAARPNWPTVALCGHTHVPMLGWWDGEQVFESSLREAGDWPASVKAVIVNPGSVGQPRDEDPRASYAVIDLEARTVRVERLAYDIERACEAIEREGLPDDLARRLREGR